jgi:hypothetical protein
MNGTFQLIRRARREGVSLRPPQVFGACDGVSAVGEAASDPGRTPWAEAPIHTGAIYRELMQKYDRITPRHLK